MHLPVDRARTFCLESSFLNYWIICLGLCIELVLDKFGHFLKENGYRIPVSMEKPFSVVPLSSPSGPDRISPSKGTICELLAALYIRFCVHLSSLLSGSRDCNSMQPVIKRKYGTAIDIGIRVLGFSLTLHKGVKVKPIYTYLASSTFYRFLVQRHILRSHKSLVSLGRWLLNQGRYQDPPLDPWRCSLSILFLADLSWLFWKWLYL